MEWMGTTEIESVCVCVSCGVSTREKKKKKKKRRVMIRRERERCTSLKGQGKDRCDRLLFQEKQNTTGEACERTEEQNNRQN